jgi:predicted nucleic acid-binding protein
MDKGTVINVFKNNAINDFEDGLQYYSALNAKCDCIITEDLKDFYFSSLKILNCRDFLTQHA